MGLLNLFLQNQSTLDVTPTPQQGNGPVGTPTGEFNTGVAPFQQTWNSDNTYVNSFEGEINNGIQPSTLNKTGLDADNPDYVPSTTTPNTLTAYPATAKGGLQQSALQFIQIWNPIINYNDVVAGALTSPLEQSLDQTGLDNTNANAVPTTTIPNIPTVYPILSTGEYNSVSNQYTQIYTPNKTYLNNFNPNTQPNTLNKTGLDNTDSTSALTTETPNTITTYPLPPQTNLGEFGGAPTQFNQQYTPNPGHGYLNSVEIQDPNSPQISTLNQTGLDNTNNISLTSTFVPNNVTAPTDYGIPSPSPEIQMGKFGGGPSQYQVLYTPEFNYLDKYSIIISNTGNPQINTLDKTGLDNTNANAVPTTTVPSTVTQYPANSKGEFQGVSNQYTQIWSADNTYASNFNPNTQPNTLGQTGLDINNNSAIPTTTTPSTVTQYPQFTRGEFGGASSQYSQIWGPTNQYIVNYDPNTQSDTLVQTGLDTENQNASPTTTSPNTITEYPFLASGEFGGAPGQYTQTYTSDNTYLNSDTIENQQTTLSLTGLDNTILIAAPTTEIPDIPTSYPQPPQTNLGEFNGAPSQFVQQYNPNPGQGYLNYISIQDPNSPQSSTLSLTGLDSTDTTSDLTALVNFQTPSTPTILPPDTFMGKFGGAPSVLTSQTNTYSPNPGQGYLDSIEVQDPNSPQISTLGETGLDNTNDEYLETTSSPLPVNVPVTPQTLLNVSVEMSPSGSITQFSQKYKPLSRYLDYIDALSIESK